MTTSTHERLIDCPACKKPITAAVTYEVEPGERAGKTVTATLTLTGVRVQHDCMLRADRPHPAPRASQKRVDASA